MDNELHAIETTESEIRDLRSKYELSDGLSATAVQERWELWLKTNPEVCGATVNYRWIRKAFFDAAEGR